MPPTVNFYRVGGAQHLGRERHPVEFVFTIGSGKNGTHVLDKIFQVASRGRVFSSHEPRPYLDMVEAFFYEGRMTLEQLLGNWTWQEWAAWLRRAGAAAGADLVHVANNHLTNLVPALAATFPGCKFILPVREDKVGCVCSLRAVGCYDWVKMYPQPADFHTLAAWQHQHPIVKCAWLMEMRNRRGKLVTCRLPTLHGTTEQINTIDWLCKLSEFVPTAALDVGLALVTANKRQTPMLSKRERQMFRDEYAHYRGPIEMVQNWPDGRF